MTGVGASRSHSTGVRSLAHRTSAAASENSRPRNRVSWPIMTMGLRAAMGDLAFFLSAFKKSAMPCVAMRTLSKVKSRAMRPRHPDVPNLIAIVSFAPRTDRVKTYRGPSLCRQLLLPIQRAFLQRIHVANEQHAQE